MLAGLDTGRVWGDEGSRATGMSFYPENRRRLCPKASPRHVGYMAWNEIFDLRGHLRGHDGPCDETWRWLGASPAHSHTRRGSSGTLRVDLRTSANCAFRYNYKIQISKHHRTQQNTHKPSQRHLCSKQFLSGKSKLLVLCSR
eukprot:COSAG01_NODE_23848_length_799_cov_2.391429_2_plen_142_part_01